MQRKTIHFLIMVTMITGSLYFSACGDTPTEQTSEAATFSSAGKQAAPPSGNPVDSSCFQNTSMCTDASCQQIIANAHMITDSAFDAMHNEYISTYNPKVDSTRYLMSRFKRIDSLNCEEKDHIGFSTFDGDDNILVSINDIIPFDSSNNISAYSLMLTIAPAKTTVKKMKLPAIEAADSVREEKIILGRYSIALFKGLIAKYNLKDTDAIVFIKILGYEKDGTRKPTAAMKIIDKTTGKPAYADLSQYYP